MRIVQVTGSFAPARCGVAHYTARLATTLSQLGARVAIASGPTDAHPPTELLPLSSSRWTVWTLREVLTTARRWKADWLHLQFAPGSFSHQRVVGLLPLLTRLHPDSPRLAVTVHEYGGWSVRLPSAVAPVAEPFLRLAEQAGWLERELLFLLSLADLVIVTNPDHQATIRDRSKQLARRLNVVPIGANVGPELVSGLDREEIRQQLGIPGEQIVAIFFGFVHPVKGIETLLQAMQLIRQSGRTIWLWIVGGVESLALRGAEADAYERRIRQLIQELGLADTVTFTGFLDDDEAARRLRAADLSVLPFNRGITLKSGSLITCLAYGLPVVATRGGALTDLRHSENIWLVPPRDPVQLATAITMLAQDGDLRARLGIAGARVARQFQWSTIAHHHLELYQRSTGPVVG